MVYLGQVQVLKVIVGVQDLLVYLRNVESGEQESLLPLAAAQHGTNLRSSCCKALRLVPKDHTVLSHVTMLYQTRCSKGGGNKDELGGGEKGAEKKTLTFFSFFFLSFLKNA